MNPIKERITLDEAKKVDVRICEIITCERLPKKDRLLKLTINTGAPDKIEQTVVTNLGNILTPEQLIGKRLPFIVNLQPVVLAGVESSAMIVVAHTETQIDLIESPLPAGSELI